LRPGRRFARAEASAGSPRARLARLALDAALALPDVLGADAGPHGLRVTADRSGLLRGVSVTADGEGRYAVDLRLVVRMVPLMPLSDEIRERVRRRAGREGLEDELGLVNVEFGRLVTDEEVVAEAALAAEAATDEPAGEAAPPPGGVEIRPPARPPGALEPPPAGLAPPPAGREPPPTGLAPPPAAGEPPPTGLAPPPTDPAPPPAVPPPPLPPDRGGGP
jgi:hypothetical protein